MSKEKIIFLDFDGVITTARSSFMDRDSGITNVMDPISLNMIKRLVKDYQAQIVLTTSWARTDPMDKKHRDHFADLFKITGNAGLAYALHKDWKVTEDYEKAKSLGRNPRSLAIDQWLDGHSPLNYLIIDDDMIAEGDQVNHFVHSDPLNGMKIENFVDGSKILSIDYWD